MLFSRTQPIRAKAHRTQPRWLACLRWFCLAVLCGLSSACRDGDPNVATGENNQLRERLSALEADKASLESKVDELQSETLRLSNELAAATGGQGLGLEERQRQLDDRLAAFEERERTLRDHEERTKLELSQRQQELHLEYATREEAVLQREQGVAQKEQEFYERTSMTLEEVGEAKQIKSEFENMRSDRDSALQSRERWLIGFSLVLLFCLAILFWFAFLSFRLKQRLSNAHVSLEAFKMIAQLPPEQVNLAVDAVNRLGRIEDHRDKNDG